MSVFNAELENDWLVVVTPLKVAAFIRVRGQAFFHPRLGRAPQVGRHLVADFVRQVQPLLGGHGEDGVLRGPRAPVHRNAQQFLHVRRRIQQEGMDGGPVLRRAEQTQHPRPVALHVVCDHTGVLAGLRIRFEIDLEVLRLAGLPREPGAVQILAQRRRKAGVGTDRSGQRGRYGDYDGNEPAAAHHVELLLMYNVSRFTIRMPLS